MNKVNYDTLLEDTISKIKAANTRPSLLLHACCAPCSSAVLERIAKYFKIDIFYYNPNITPKREVDKRIEEVEKLLKLEPGTEGIRLIPGKYDPESFEAIAKGREMIPEGGERCYERKERSDY